MFGVVFLADYLFSTLSQTRNALNNRHAQQAFLFVIFGIYFVWFWNKGQTLAMKTWHIRVTTTQGLPLTQRHAFVRYLLSWLWFLPPLAISWALGLHIQVALLFFAGWIVLWAVLALLHPQRQFWHDALAHTRLIHSASANKN